MDTLQITPTPAPADEGPDLLPCEIYGAWQCAFDDEAAAYLAWCTAPLERKAEAYCVYRAAADREDTAAAHWLAV